MIIDKRQAAEDALRRAHDELEQRVAARTAQLSAINVALVAEIAERKRAEAERTQILQRLMTAQEDERRRIARELHDQCVQQLSALKLQIGRLTREFASPPSLQEQLHFARQGHGRSGACRDYVLAATKELQALGIRDQDLQVLAERLKGVHESPAR